MTNDARMKYSSGSAWEPLVGYSRVVKCGNIIEVSGTVAATADGSAVHKGDAYAQTVFILHKIEAALHEAGASLAQVTRTRMFVTDISRWQEYGRAHGEFFGTIRPCTSMIGISALVDPDCLIEIEATAVISSSS